MEEDRKRRHQDYTIPPRWLNCPRKGDRIEMFIPFKTPLDQNYDNQVPENKRFTPDMMLSNQEKLGLWIDLTNTSRFYDKKTVEAHKVKYIKIQCKGHGACPNEEQTQFFISMVNAFIHHHPGKLVGVHCTHGFNRTGFLIISYLVECLSWSVEVAINAFSKARLPGIYKQDYLDILFKRFGDPEDMTLAPALPDWCLEEEERSDEEKETDAFQAGKSSRPAKRRKTKKDPTFMDGVPGVSSVSDPDKLWSIQLKIKQWCEWDGMGFPGSQPVSMDRKNICFLSQIPYMVSWKADGTRYMMLIDGEDKVYFIDRDNSVFQITGIQFFHRKNLSEHIKTTLVDGEMIIDKVNGKDVPRYLIYDIIKFGKNDVGKTTFPTRMLCIKKELIEPRIEAMRKGIIVKEREPFSIRIKDFWDPSCAERLLGEKFSSQVSHEIDGLIFQPAELPYKPGTCLEVLKWKPLDMNSVDFRLKIVKDTREGMLPTSIGHLYCSGYDSPFSEIKITKALKPYNNKIIECKLEDNQWKFMRERTDKSFPNAYKTVMAIMASIREPVTKEFLLNYIALHAWKKDKELMPPPPFRP